MGQTRCSPGALSVKFLVAQPLRERIILGGQQSFENGEEIRVTQDMIEGVLKSCLTAKLRVREIAIEVPTKELRGVLERGIRLDIRRFCFT
jgi:hypothetical protein